LRGYFLIITALAIWSTWGLVVRWLDKPVAVIVFYNALFALCFQGMALLAARKREGLYIDRDLGAILLLGVCGLCNILSFFYALKVTTVASALLTHYTAPVLVAILAPLMLKDRMGRSTLLALAISAAGLVLIFLRGLGISGGAGLVGALSGTFSGLAYAFVIIFSRGISGRHNPVKVMFLQGFVPVLAIGVYLMAGGSGAGGMGLTLRQGLVLALVGLVHSTLANVLYLYGIREVTAQEAGVLGYLEPVLGITLAFLFLGETPHLLAILGGALIVLSGFIVVRGGVRDVGRYS
jgi:drug/metabolite transporter (DMT)-like permease